MSGERARLFVALDLPAEARLELAAWCPAMGELRPVALDSLHVTLCFIGARPVADIEAIAGLTAAASQRRPAAPGLRLAEPVWLPPRRPRVLAVRLDDVAGALGRLQAELEATLVAGGHHQPERRAFLSHVTVARVRRDARIRLPVALPRPAARELAAEAVTLYRSRPVAGGARYEPLRRVVLES